MREPNAEWVRALKLACGAECDLRWNLQVGRWEFLLPGGDGVPRSQFWGWFWTWKHGKKVPLKPDPETGLHPFRDLDTEAMAEALENLTRTFVGNRHDGAGTPAKEIRKRMRENKERGQKQYQAAGMAFADMAAERGRRLRGSPQVPIITNLSD